MVDMSALDQFVDGATDEDDDEIKPIETPDHGRRILAIDQSIANSGWALIAGEKVTYTGNIKTVPNKKGHEDTLRRGAILYSEYDQLIHDLDPHLIVHEMPPVGGRMMRPESSLVAAMTLRISALNQGVPVIMIGAQKAKKRLTGNGNAKKNLVREAILKMDPTIKNKKPMNEAVYDAIAIGWVACEMEGEINV